MLDAGAAGVWVARPFVDKRAVYVIVDAPRRLWRVQVKAERAVHYQGFGVRACWRSSRGICPYTKEQIDFYGVVIESRRNARKADLVC